MSHLNHVKNELEQRRNELEHAVTIAQKDLHKAPKGNLRISHNKGTVQYYKITESGDTRGKYIKKRDIGIAMSLAQKHYNERLIKAANTELSIVNNMLENIDILMQPTITDVAGSIIHANPKITATEHIYLSTSIERKRLVNPIIYDDEGYASRWIHQEYNTNEYRSEEKIYQTKKGDMVRSKSEMLLADMFYDLQIPYRYEAELVLNSKKHVYPDFTLLKSDTRQIIYYEHMGLMDDEEYRNNNLRKIEEYRKNGIFIGKNLIVTFESVSSPLNLREIEKSIKEIFLKM